MTLLDLSTSASQHASSNHIYKSRTCVPMIGNDMRYLRDWSRKFSLSFRPIGVLILPPPKSTTFTIILHSQPTQWKRKPNLQKFRSRDSSEFSIETDERRELSHPIQKAETPVVRLFLPAPLIPELRYRQRKLIRL